VVVAAAGSAEEARVAAGDLKRLDKTQHRAVTEAVATAEAFTGLQFCVFLGSIDDDNPREHARALFLRAGMHELPAVLLAVGPKQRRVEVVTGPHARARISDEDAAEAVSTMTASFAVGDLAGGVIAGLRQLAHIAGPGTAESRDEGLPDIVDEDDPGNRSS